MEDKPISVIEALGMTSMAATNAVVQAIVIAQHRKIKEQGVDIKSLEKEMSDLLAFYKAWSPIANKLNERRNTLNKFNLVNTINALPEPIKAAYKESIACFFFGKDLASASMLCLTIETMVRQAANDNNLETSLFLLINNLVKQKKLTPHLQDKLHILRKIRNLQSHNVQNLRELDLLSLFQAVVDLAKELGYGG